MTRKNNMSKQDKISPGLFQESQPIKLRELSAEEKRELEFMQEASELFICKSAERAGILKKLLAMAEGENE